MTINHLELHPHAFIDNNNMVIDVLAFEELAHDSSFLEDVRNQIKAKQVVCCCTFGQAGIGNIWTGTEFQTPSPHKGWIWDSKERVWNPPFPFPEDGPLYVWDDVTENWIEAS